MVRNYLKSIDLYLKIMLVLLINYLLYPFMIDDIHLRTYFYRLAAMTVFIVGMYGLIFSPKAVMLMLCLWFLGNLYYLAVSIPLIYSSATLTPYMHLSTVINRWLYALSHPLRWLAALALGSIFVGSISPIEFLRWGNVGLYMAVFFRMIENAIQNLANTRTALQIQGEWPEAQSWLSYFAPKFILKSIRSCIALVIITYRNILLWSPKAFVHFHILQGTTQDFGKGVEQ
ncbi:MAG: hypothetical protein JO316_05430 [Abitibacteriaceae bacterium]|nr:hypothetical protein [Abditibacteriaceae bacterium]